ncbi:MAG TPA: ATPase, T2SS/T4P/T4SS family, partial [Casimicrobiaceae bacterium]|nr:ATPase, T2SS/T4P/T4SS family [Casimicrobiaceae bacterium]
MATPLTDAARPDPPGARSAKPAAAADRRLRLDEILTLMLADGLIAQADADRLASARTQRFEHPLELIADQRLRSQKPPGKVLTLDALVEWLAGRLGVPYMHVDPLKVDLGAVTATMSNAYAERYRILPVAVDRQTLTVATGEPFVRSFADELARILKLDVRFVFANPVDVRRYIGEFFNLARSMKRAQESSRGDFAIARNFEQLVELGRHGHLDANDQHVVHIVDWLWQYAFDQRASDIHVEPRRDVGLVRFRIDGVLHQVYAIPTAVLNAVTSRIKLLARMEIVEKRRPQDGRIKTVAPDGQEIELRISTMPTAFGEKIVMRIFDPDIVVKEFVQLGFSSEEEKTWRAMVERPHGIVLVT